jgi:erythromycin esterase
MDQKVQFFGFDMQLERYSIMQLADKLKKLDSVYFKDHFALVLTMEIYDDDKNVFTKYSKNEIDSIKTLLVNIGNYVNANKTTLAKLYSTDEIAFTERDIVLLEQCLEEGMAANNDKVSTVSQNEVRDKYMAENVQWILDHEGPDSKMMLWAHNRHIDKHGGGFSSLGAYLKTAYNDQYYAIGFDFNKGSFNAFEPKSSTIKVFTVSNSREGSSGDFFSRTGLPVFFIDIEKAVKTNSDLEKFFTKNIYHREVGGGYDPSTDENKSYFNEPLYKLYNGLIFVDKTAATTLFKKQ